MLISECADIGSPFCYYKNMRSEKEMGSKNYTNLDGTIELMANILGIEYSDRVIKRIRYFAKEYRSAHASLNIIPGITSSFSDEAAGVIEEMIFWEKFREKDLKNIITHLLIKGNLENMIEKALEKVKNFGVEGPCYYKVLDFVYFGRMTFSNVDVMNKLCLSRTAFYDRIRRGLMLFGISVWGLVIESKDNPEKFMNMMEVKYGLDQ